jgi:uncharacterized protein (DUF58 family)
MRTTSRGWALVLIAFLFYFFANQTQVGWLYVLCALTLGVWLGARFLPQRMLRNLRLIRRLNGRSSPQPAAGETDLPAELELYANQALTVELEIENVSPLPALQIRGGEVCPLAPAGERDQSFFIPTLSARARVRVRYETVCARRGWFEFPPLPLTTRAPFGFYAAARTVAAPTGVLVFPEYRELKRLPLFDRMPAQENPFPQIGLAGEFMGVRDYRPGHSRRQVHWRSTARAGRLIVKEFAEETQPGLTIALDLRAASVLGVDPHTSLELAIKIAATLARYADRQNLPVHLAVNNRQWPAPPGPVSWWGLLNYLARVEAAGAESFADCLRGARPTTYLAALLTAPDLSAIDTLREARRAGWGVLAILIDPAPFGGPFDDVPRLEAALLTAGVPTRVIGAEPEWEKVLEVLN